MSNEDPRFVDVSSADPESVSGEQFVHGVLQTMYCDSDTVRRQRIARLVSSLNQEPRQLRRPFLNAQRTAVMVTIAAALLVVSVLGFDGRESAEQVISSLSLSQSEDAKFNYLLRGLRQSVRGELDIGQPGERLLSVETQSESNDYLLLRGADASCLFRDQGPPVAVGGWPRWLITDGLAISTMTPREWVKLLRDTHTFEIVLASSDAPDRALGQVDQSNGLGHRRRLPLIPSFDRNLLSGSSWRCIAGSRRSEAVDPLVPESSYIWVDESSQQILALTLIWSPDDRANRPSRVPEQESVRLFERLDLNHDGKVGRVEAGSEWVLFSSAGFGDRQMVTLEQFCQSSSSDPEKRLVELRVSRPDLESCQPPVSMLFTLQSCENRPPWLFVPEVFSRW